MASHRIETYCQRLAFPIGALIFSRAVDRLVRAGRLDPIPYSGATPVATGETSTSSNGRPTAPRFNQVLRWSRTT